MSDQQKTVPLRRADLESDPIRQFRRWFEKASRSGIAQPHAMALATATPDGVPAVRFVLLRHFDEQGFVFFTNYESQKGNELAANSVAALVFYWEPLGRQVRITGRVERIAEAESDQYFDSRSLESRIGAVISRQSQVIPNREFMEHGFSELQAATQKNDKIVRPAYWGGYRLAPNLVEFWQHRDHRLHDRFRYTRQEGAGWLIQRLSP
jgi:pyridoxamine 5'-phosphate oxidase